MVRPAQNALQRAWQDARAAHGQLVLLAGADTELVSAAVADLVASATREGAQIRAIRAAHAQAAESDALIAQGDFEASAEVAAQLRTDSLGAPQLVVLERVEQADSASLRLLAFLAREVRDAAVLLVATRSDVATAPDSDRERALADLARAGRWISLEAPVVATATSDAPSPPLSLVREGEFWTLARGERRVTLRDARGFQHLAQLIAEPGRSWRALDLAGGVDDDGGETLDAAARAAYRRELAHLEQAGSQRDAAFVARTLARDTGLGGRARRIDSSAERARGAVTRSIQRAIAAIGAQDAELGRWLAASIRTGHECRFDPIE